MVVPELVAFRDLFEGNTKFYGTEEGGCKEAVSSWSTLSEWHLTGASAPIGVYPMHKWETENHVGWGCVDFDEGEEESRTHAQNVVNCLAEFEITGWIERSRSKGYHVWVFKDGTVAANIMRPALLAACQIVGAPTKEINPKQDTLSPGKVGNYVRLPYPGGLHVCPERRVVIESDTGMNLWLHEFVGEALAAREGEVTRLKRLAQLYVPPRTYSLTDVVPSSEMEGDAVERLSGLARTIFEQGPREDQPVTDAHGYDNGRSTRLWKLACLIRENGQHDIDEALELVVDADKRWGKFHERGEPEYITRLVGKAWGLDD